MGVGDTPSHGNTEDTVCCSQMAAVAAVVTNPEVEAIEALLAANRAANSFSS